MEEDLWEDHGGDRKKRSGVTVECKRMEEFGRGQEYLQVSYCRGQGQMLAAAVDVPHIKHTICVMETNRLRLYKEIIAVCSQIHTKHINTLWAERRIAEC